MRTYREMRQDAWAKATHGWCGRIFISYALLILIFVLALCLVKSVAGGDFVTWEKFFESKAQAKMAGVDYTVPSTAAAGQMTLASLLDNLVQWLFGGILSFGLAAVLLKAVKGDERGWFGSAFGGFKRPFGVLWLTVLMSIRIFLWALLFVIPGIIAAYRYSMAWYVKAEEPEWSAGKCLAESGRLMKGYKWKLCVFSCTYLGWFFLALAAVLLPTAAAEVPSLPSWAALVGLAVMLAGLFLFAFIFVYAALGQAVFYLEVKKLASSEGSAAS